MAIIPWRPHLTAKATARGPSWPICSLVFHSNTDNKSGVKQTLPGALIIAVALILTLAQKNITRHVRWKRYVNSYENSIRDFVFGLKSFQESRFVYGCCIPQCQRWKAKPGTKSSVAVHHLPQLGVTVHKIKLSVPVSVCSIKMSLSIKL